LQAAFYSLTALFGLGVGLASGSFTVVCHEICGGHLMVLLLSIGLLAEGAGAILFPQLCGKELFSIIYSIHL